MDVNGGGWYHLGKKERATQKTAATGDKTHRGFGRGAENVSENPWQF